MLRMYLYIAHDLFPKIIQNFWNYAETLARYSKDASNV